jgi:elongation factor G
VTYRETIKKNAEAEYRHVRQTGGHGQYGHVKLRAGYSGAGNGFIFENQIVGGTIPKEYISAIKSGVQEVLTSGTLAGYPMVDVRVELYDGSYHEVDSSEMAFSIAASMAFREACRRATPVLLEPIMRVEVTVPAEYLGEVINDLNSRRGRIQKMEAHLNLQIIQALVPMAEIFGYATGLRSLTQGRGNHTLHFDDYKEVPKTISDDVIARVSGVSRH